MLSSYHPLFVAEFWKNNPNYTLEVSRLTVVKNSSQYNLPRMVNMSMKFAQEMHQSITFQTTSSTIAACRISCLIR